MQPLGLVKLELWEDDILFIVQELKVREAHLQELADKVGRIGRDKESQGYRSEGEKCGLTADLLAVLMVANSAR